MKKIAATLAAAWAVPVFAFAQVRSLYDAGTTVTNLINDVLVPLIFLIAFVVFIWGIFQYFIAAGNDEKREEGKKLMLYGIIGFFLMVSVWGLVNILVGTFNLNQNPPQLPAGPGPR